MNRHIYVLNGKGKTTLAKKIAGDNLKVATLPEYNSDEGFTSNFDPDKYKESDWLLIQEISEISQHFIYCLNLTKCNLILDTKHCKPKHFKGMIGGFVWCNMGLNFNN